MRGVQGRRPTVQIPALPRAQVECASHRACRARPGICYRPSFALWMLNSIPWPHVGLLIPFLLRLW